MSEHLDHNQFRETSPLKLLHLILAKILKMERQLSTLAEQAQALKDDVDRVLADQAAAISKAVAAALAAQGVDETAAGNIMTATQQAIDAFDPPPVVPPTPAPAA